MALPFTKPTDHDKSRPSEASTHDKAHDKTPELINPAVTPAPRVADEGHPNAADKPWHEREAHAGADVEPAGTRRKPDFRPDDRER